MVKFKTNLECQRSNVPFLNLPTMYTEPGLWAGAPWPPAGLCTSGNRCPLFSYRIFSSALFKLVLTSSIYF